MAEYLILCKTKAGGNMGETKKIRQNGMIELIRFLCSVWVAYYHGFFPVLSDKFGGVNVSVDIFFMITGFFFLKSMEKYARILKDLACGFKG